MRNLRRAVAAHLVATRATRTAATYGAIARDFLRSSTLAARRIGGGLDSVESRVIDELGPKPEFDPVRNPEHGELAHASAPPPKSRPHWSPSRSRSRAQRSSSFSATSTSRRGSPTETSKGSRSISCG
jgi:hypothetical protein